MLGFDVFDRVLPGQRLSRPENMGITPPWASMTLPVAPTSWYDPSDTSTVTHSGGSVSAITDKMGTNNASQGSAGLRPGLVRTPCGLMAHAYNASRMDSNFSMADLTVSFFLVACVSDLVGVRTLIGPSADDGLQWRLSTGGALEVMEADVALIGTSTLTVTPGEPFVAGVICTATTLDYFVNGATDSDAHTAGLTATRTFRLGAAPSIGGAEPFRGWIGEVIAFDSNISTANGRVLVEYLAYKWGVTL